MNAALLNADFDIVMFCYLHGPHHNLVRFLLGKQFLRKESILWKVEVSQKLDHFNNGHCTATCIQNICFLCMYIVCKHSLYMQYLIRKLGLKKVNKVINLRQLRKLNVSCIHSGHIFPLDSLSTWCIILKSVFVSLKGSNFPRNESYKFVYFEGKNK